MTWVPGSMTSTAGSSAARGATRLPARRPGTGMDYSWPYEPTTDNTFRPGTYGAVLKHADVPDEVEAWMDEPFELPRTMRLN